MQLTLPNLESDRLILRAFSPEDAPEVQNLAGAFEVADTTMNIPHPYGDGLAESWVANQKEVYSSGKGATYAIVSKSHKRLIGAISLMNIEPGHQAELGYWIGVPYWGQGFCTEAGKLVTQYAFEKLNLTRLHARHLSRNTASGRVLSKLGFKHEGSMKSHVKKWGKFEDIESYGLMSATLPHLEQTEDQREKLLVALNVIQSVECDESGVAYPHVITRLLEDGIMTLLSMPGSSRAGLKTSPVTLDALTIGNHQPCVANQTVAVYCKMQINPQGQNPHHTFQLRIVCTQSGNLIADSNIQISQEDIQDIALPCILLS